MCIHLGMSIKAEENDKVATITDMEGLSCKATAQGRAAVKILAKCLHWSMKSSRVTFFTVHTSVLPHSGSRIKLP